MLDFIRFKLQLNKLRKKQKKMSRHDEKLIQKEEKGANREREVGALIAEAMYVRDEIEDEINLLVTSRLCSMASKFMLPIPDRSNEDMWTDTNNYSNQQLLMPKGISELRSMIRKEQRERIGHIVLWLSALTGVIGALTGLFAVLLKK